MILVGKKQALAMAIKNDKATKRWSMLEKRLCSRTHSLPKLGQQQIYSASIKNLEECVDLTSDGEIKLSRQILVIMNKSHDVGINP